MSKVMTMIKDNKSATAFIALFVILVVSIGLQSGYQSNFGDIDVRTVEIRSYDGRVLVGKLYRPIEANSTNPLPGVLAIHGYNNDKDVQRPNAIELAKRGIVVLAIDCLHQGDSDKGDFVFGVSSRPYEAYDWLVEQAFVDPEYTGVVGHSMGAGFALQVALKYPEIDVLGYQAFGPNNFASSVATLRSFNTNIIQISSAAEEFGGRLYDQTKEEWAAFCQDALKNNTIAAGIDDGTGEFYKTYGGIFAGSAQRYVFIDTTHPAQTHDINATKEITSFFLQSLKRITPEVALPQVETTTYIWADVWGTIAALSLMLCIIPLLSLLLKSNFFAEVAQPMPEIKPELETKTKMWWIFASFNMLIGGIVYLLNTNSPNNAEWLFSQVQIYEWTPNMDLSIANAFTAFYVVNAVINVIFVAIWFFLQAKKKGGTSYDMGVSYKKEKFSIKWSTFLKTILIAIIIFGFMYLMTAFAQWAFVVEIRGPWAMFKTFTVSRAAEFWQYYWGVLFFWIFNAGIWLFGLMRQKEYGSEWKTVLIWWLKVMFAMLTGLVILNIIGYGPMIFGWSGPLLQGIVGGVAPMNLLQTWSFIPIAMVMFLIAVIYYRKTGKIWLGTILLAAIGTWMMVTGTVQDGYVLYG